MVLSVVHAVMTKMHIPQDSRVISYLPYPHSFEQCMMGMALVAGCKIGYYNGNPATLTEDCQLLRPTIFPSVPRLYTRIYGTIKQKFGDLKGCTAWIANKGVVAKT